MRRGFCRLAELHGQMKPLLVARLVVENLKAALQKLESRVAVLEKAPAPAAAPCAKVGRLALPPNAKREREREKRLSGFGFVSLQRKNVMVSPRRLRSRRRQPSRRKTAAATMTTLICLAAMRRMRRPPASSRSVWTPTPPRSLRNLPSSPNRPSCWT